MTVPATHGEGFEPSVDGALPVDASTPVRVPVGRAGAASSPHASALPSRPAGGSPLVAPVPRIAGEEIEQAPTAQRQLPSRPAPGGGALPKGPRGPRPDWYTPPVAEETPEASAPVSGSGVIVSGEAPVRVPLRKPARTPVAGGVEPVLVDGQKMYPVGAVAPLPSKPVTVDARPVRTPVGKTSPVAPAVSTPSPVREETPEAGERGLPATRPTTSPYPVEDSPSLPVAPPSLPEQEREEPVLPVEVPSPVVEEEGPAVGFADALRLLTGGSEVAPAPELAEVGSGQVVVTAAGTVLTPEVEEALAVEAEAGYEVEQARPERVLPVRRPMVAPAPESEMFSDEAGEDGDAGSRGASRAAGLPTAAPSLPVARPTVTLPTAAPVAEETPVVGKPVRPEAASTEEWSEDVVEVDPEDVFPADDPEAVAERAREAKAKKSYGVKVTERDVLLLQYLSRYRYATYSQIADYLGTTVNALRQRFPRLKKAGVIVSDNAGTSQSLVWRPTETGVLLSGLDLPTPTLSWATAAHTLGLVDIGIRFEAAGETVVTEREIRAADTRERPTDRMLAAKKFYGPVASSTDVDTPAPLYVVSLGAGEGQYTHIPDLVLVRPPADDGSPQSVAIELELNRKPPAQWRKVLRAYRDARNIGYVVYYTHRKDIRNGIQSAAIELGMTDIIEVRKFTPAADSAIPLPA